MGKLTRLKPRVRLLTDFYVFDVETKVTYKEWVTQRKIFNEHHLIKPKTKGIYWGLKSRPENFVFGVIYGYNYTKVIHNVKEFKETLQESRFKGRNVFAHNATYDLTTLYGNIYTIDPSAIFNGSRFIVCSNGNCNFADSMNIFVGQSVKKIGEQLGLKKEQLGDTLHSLEGVTSKEINYCIRDCQIVWDALFKSFEFAGDIKITQASLSMTYFRRWHQPYTIEYNENVEFFRDSYYGGRTEAFYIGDTHGVAYDRKSAYWYSLRNVVFPNPKHLKLETNVKIKHLPRYLNNYEGCIYATIEHTKSWIGLLPIKKGGKLLFPVGMFSGCWNFNEFRFALPYIRIREIDKIIYSERMASPFVGFIDKLFELKNKAEIDGNDFWRDLYKRYGNSLYGKFAQLIDEVSEYIENMEKQFGVIEQAQKNNLFIKLILFNVERLDCFLVTKSNKGIKCSYSIPSFASYITSDARVELGKKLLACGEKNVLYCDTDSVFLRNDSGMTDEKFLGGWGREKKIITEIHGLKNYKFVDEKTGMEKRRLKGVPDKATKNNNIYEYFNLIKTKESLRRNIDAGILTKRTKEISGLYDKRIVLPDGETKPIILC